MGKRITEEFYSLKDMIKAGLTRGQIIDYLKRDMKFHADFLKDENTRESQFETSIKEIKRVRRDLLKAEKLPYGKQKLKKVM